jgi:hypothetical protein
MNTTLKKALLVFGGGFLLFLAFKRIKPFGGSKKGSSRKGGSMANNSQKKNAAIVLKAYSDAMAAGENKAFLDEMNSEFAKTYKMRVVPNKANGKLMATDLDGNKIA